MRKMDWYFDHYGLLVCKPWPNPIQYDEGDGGDSAQKTGLNRFLRYLKFKNEPDKVNREENKFAQELDMLEDPKRKHHYRRHPDTAYWWSRSNNFTRDQQRSLVMAMGALRQKKRLFGLLWEHIKRFGFYQNNRHPDESLGWKMPDFAAPNHWGEYIRAIYMLGGVFKVVAVLYPLLMICDVGMIVALALASRHWKNPDEADDDNTIMCTLQAKVALPTPISYIARKFYLYYRPIAGYMDMQPDQKSIPLRGTTNKVEMSGPESALWYKHHEIHQGPPYYDNYVDVLKKYLRS